jgi:hypothetical protein
MNTGDREMCPACLSVSAAVAAAWDSGRPCPHCSLPHAAIGFVQDGRNQKLPGAFVDAFVEYARDAVIRGETASRLEAELRAAEREREGHKARAESGHALLRAEQERSDEYRRTTEADLARLRWRIANVRSKTLDALDEPYPEALR